MTSSPTSRTDAALAERHDDHATTRTVETRTDITGNPAPAPFRTAPDTPRPPRSTAGALAQFGTPDADAKRITDARVLDAEPRACAPDSLDLDSQRKITGAIDPTLSTVPQVNYLSIDNDFADIVWDDIEPILFTSDMEKFMEGLDDDDTIITFDGSNVFSSKQPMSAPEVLTAYKRVDRKVKPVPAVFPEDARVIRRFPEDPLASLPPLTPRPPVFKPNGGRLTQENLDSMNLNPEGFLWPEELKLFQHILLMNQNHFVFEDSQRGTFREDYFSPYIIPEYTRK
ncbi:hypothetical protein PsYK624_168470 [Phanerochaete sordida]|uniref:Uncharacterized protein n=1 Tax=Phanerochaete sordida TaxID=48140 RepID=A0A9P3GSV6_9APHY|nr:hypothetical protein PsYK624_168470 [Phanerochaete sordida]